MACSSIKSRTANKWVVLFAACLIQTFSTGYTNSTGTFLSNYFSQRFNDRVLAGVIIPLQGAFSCITALPALYMIKYLGERVSQVSGGLMLVIGTACTAFTTEGWQALLASGILAAYGKAICVAAPYSIVGKYFPGKQLVPYAALSISYTIGNIVAPQLIGSLMASLGFTNCMLVSSGFLAINILGGFLFAPKELETEDHQESTAPEKRFHLKLKGSKGGSFSPEALQTDGAQAFSADLHSSHWTGYGDLKKVMRKSSSISTLLTYLNYDDKCLAEENVGTEKGGQNDKIPQVHNPPIKDKLTDLLGQNIGNVLDDTKSTKASLRKLFRKPHVIAYAFSCFLTQAGFFAFNAVIADYCNYRLGFTNDEFNLGMTIVGIAMLPTGLFYLFLTRCTTFSSSFLCSVNLSITASVFFLMLTEPSLGVFYAFMSVYGMCRVLYIGNLLPTCMEITSPSQAMLMMMAEYFFSGLGGLGSPYLAAFLQVEVDIKYGLVLGGSLMIASSLIVLPLGIRNLIAPKSYTTNNEMEDHKLSVDFVSKSTIEYI